MKGVNDLGIKIDYLNNAVDAILQMDPSLKKDQVSEIVRDEMRKSIRDPSIFMDNNVTGESYTTTLTNLCNWITETKPVIAGNATFYRQPKELRSPSSTMLKSLKKLRKSQKAEMFANQKNPDRYAQLDLGQQNTKVVMNADYGASGAPTSAFYTKYSPAATTMMAQSIITTMAAFFEGFIGMNQKFFNFNECIDWMLTVKRMKSTDALDKWVSIPTVEETIHEVRRRFHQYNIADDECLKSFIANCSDHDRAFIFYNNNLHAFIKRHPNVAVDIKDAINKLPKLDACESVPDAYQKEFGDDVTKYNNYVAKEMFLDPYNVPEIIKENISRLTKHVMKYCYMPYLTPDSIPKLNNHKRNTVLLVDTDSNVLYTDMFIKFILDGVFGDVDFGRDRMYCDMITCNILASILSACVADLLNVYGLSRNADDESRKELTMKNEFFFRVFFVMNVKKRYAASIALREGHIMVPFKTEIKGVDFIKAGVDDIVTKRFTDILKQNILFAPEPNLHGMMKDIRQFEKEIYDDLKKGSTIYLKTLNYKARGAYKDPWGTQAYKAVMVWNALVPEQKISSLSKVKLAKLIVTGPEDLDVIKDKYPEEYRRAMENIFGSVSEYNQYLADQKAKKAKGVPRGSLSDREGLMAAGMKAIAIPLNAKGIPEWLRPLIDYQNIISDIMNSFRSILDSLGIQDIPVKTPNGKARLTSGLIAM